MFKTAADLGPRLIDPGTDSEPLLRARYRQVFCLAGVRANGTDHRFQTDAFFAQELSL